MKTCSKCKEVQLFDKFSKCSKSKDGCQSVCKVCKRESVRNAPSTINRKYVKRKISDSERARRLDYYHKTKVARNISRRMRQSLKGERKSSSWTDLVDYTLSDLKTHLESLFQEGMSWDNYGEWHIDHIKPVSSFNITSDSCEEFKNCWKLSNLQPLWAVDNFKKSDKLE